MVKNLRSPLNVWYMDVGALGGPVQQVLADIQKVKDFATPSGLTLNSRKCELWLQGFPATQSGDLVDQIREALPECKLLDRSNLTLLGAPLFEESLESATSNCKKKMETMISRLPLMGAHRALFLLRSSTGTSSLTHALRASCNIAEDDFA